MEGTSQAEFVRQVSLKIDGWVGSTADGTRRLVHSRGNTEIARHIDGLRGPIAIFPRPPVSDILDHAPIIS